LFPPRPFPPSAPPLTLVFGSFDPGTLILRLGFHRAIDISALMPNQLFVNDHDTDTQYGGQGSGVLTDPTSVEVEMTELQALGFPDTRLTATSATGIVAVNDGGTWPGVLDLLLPFP
jgi:hypothetical protein